MKSAAALGLVPALMIAPLAATPTLRGTVGPDFTITLTKGGSAVHTLRPGRYRIKVTDKSDVHNFHLKGPGVNKKTGVASTGTTRWTLKLGAGQYGYFSDSQKTLRGSFRVAR